MQSFRVSLVLRLRRTLLIAFMALPASVLASGSASLASGRIPAGEWREFQRRYVKPDGRVLDTAKDGISHSEGQSYAMLLAVHMEDRAAFDLSWNWARQHLRRRDDQLMAWRWSPHLQPPVADLNNATDGDLVAAWALARAATLWREARYREEARRIARDVLRVCTAEWNGRLVLLPGAHGFRFPERAVLNLSYYAWPAFRELGRLLPSPAWARLEADGLALLAEARFGRHGLPADWVEVEARGSMRPAPGWPPRFSWDAVRIPLYLAWAGDVGADLLPRVERFWSGQRRREGIPAWVDLETGGLAPYAGHAGVRAVARLSRHALALPPGPQEAVSDATDYYGAALVLLSRVALLEAGRSAPPPPSHGTEAPGGEGGQPMPPPASRPARSRGVPDRPQQAPPLGLRVGPPPWTPHGP